jgi:hypothetical protein
MVEGPPFRGVLEEPEPERSGAYLKFVSTGSAAKHSQKPGWSFDHFAASSAGVVSAKISSEAPNDLRVTASSFRVGAVTRSLPAIQSMGPGL